VLSSWLGVGGGRSAARTYTTAGVKVPDPKLARELTARRGPIYL
jgi:hypothetical protein